VKQPINPPLPWLAPGDIFPPVTSAWGTNTDAPGLLCAGGDLTVTSLLQAYQRGVFPWFSDGQPILWWSPDPRMALEIAQFRLHPSLRKTLRKFTSTPGCEVHINRAFADVIRACSASTRHGQTGTWIVPDMVNAYIDLHQAGFAHSVETWVDGRLVGGLYCVALGQAVFGESMFHLANDASKIALSALVCLCSHHKVPRIDCQQNTRHLQSLGAHEIARDFFAANLGTLAQQPGPDWHFTADLWQQLSL
jgi:leucyl/phenylalanyl-tRNA--protein transferase